MGKSRKDIFVSLVIICDGDMNFKKELTFASRFLEQNYAHYEILLINAVPISPAKEEELTDLLTAIQKIRYIKVTSAASQKILYAAGLENSIGDIIVLTESQYLNEKTLTEGIDLCCAGKDVISGIHKQKQTMSYRLCAKIFRSFFGNMVNYNLPDNDSHFRCISRRAANAVMTTPRFHSYIFMRMANSGYPAAEFIIQANDNKLRKRNLRSSVSEAVSIIVFNSIKPLRYVSISASIVSLLAIAIALYSVIIHLVKEQVVEGWTTLMLTSSALFFFVFLFIAIFGEYMLRLIADGESIPYHVVLEKHSSVMLDFNRLNIRENSTSEYINLSQTGRDR